MFLWYLDQIKKHTHPPTYLLQREISREIIEASPGVQNFRSSEYFGKNPPAIYQFAVENEWLENFHALIFKGFGLLVSGRFVFFPPVDANDDGFGPRSTSAFLPFRCGTL